MSAPSAKPGQGPGFLRWRSWGSGERRALLLHGSGASSATWWQVGPALAEAGWRVKAPDLPAHGASPRVNSSLTPELAADCVAAELGDRSIDLLLGHGFGAAVAVALLSRHRAELVVLEEPLGPRSVDWPAAAAELQRQVAAARRDPQAAYERFRAAKPSWTEQGCRTTIRDLASCVIEDVVAGLRLGERWPTLRADGPDCPTLVIAAPDAPGVNPGADETVLRGADRQSVRELADSFVEIAGGTRLHRDRPQEWRQAVLAFTG